MKFILLAVILTVGLQEAVSRQKTDDEAIEVTINRIYDELGNNPKQPYREKRSIDKEDDRPLFQETGLLYRINPNLIKEAARERRSIASKGVPDAEAFYRMGPYFDEDKSAERRSIDKEGDYEHIGVLYRIDPEVFDYNTDRKRRSIGQEDFDEFDDFQKPREKRATKVEDKTSLGTALKDLQNKIVNDLKDIPVKLKSMMDKSTALVMKMWEKITTQLFPKNEKKP